jgi:curved DNA-binding protein CbpA
VLGIPRDAQLHDIRAAYRRLAQRHHPDNNPRNPAAEERMKTINAAYEILSDPTRRAELDRRLEARHVHKPPPAKPKQSSYRTWPPPPPHEERHTRQRPTAEPTEAPGTVFMWHPQYRGRSFLEVYDECRNRFREDRQVYWDLVRAVSTKHGERISSSDAYSRIRLQKADSDLDEFERLKLMWQSSLEWKPMAYGGSVRRVDLQDASALETALRHLKHTIFCEELRNVVTDTYADGSWEHKYSDTPAMMRTEIRLRKFRLENESLLEEHAQLDLRDHRDRRIGPDLSKTESWALMAYGIALCLLILFCIIGALAGAFT